MRTRTISPPHLTVSLALISLLACDGAPSPASVASPHLDFDRDPHTVIVNPNAQGNGVASTIQEAIDMAAEGGVVLVTAGTYSERIVIDKGITIAPIAEGTGPVVLSQSQPTSAPAAQAVILIDTPHPVVLRDFTVHHDNIRGVNVLRDADVLIARMAFEGAASGAPIVGNGVSAHYGAGTSGKRARVVVRDSRFSVGGLGVSFGGDVDGVIQRNEFRQLPNRLPCVIVSPVGQGSTMLTTPGTRTDVEIVDNLFEDCGSNVAGRFNMVVINGTAGATTEGTINIIGNTFRHTTSTACAASGILYAFYSGVIEYNTLVGVTQPCSPPTAANNERGAIYVGQTNPGIRPAHVAVRFNDFVDNAYAALRIGPNQPTPLDATCNWWGSADGPSSVGATEGTNAIVVQPGGATPRFEPFATALVASSNQASCTPR
jgi:hypothetical protein